MKPRLHNEVQSNSEMTYCQVSKHPAKKSDIHFFSTNTGSLLNNKLN